MKPFPLIIKPKKTQLLKDFETTAKNAFRKYRKKYKNYFLENQLKTKQKKVMLDTSPRVIFVQDIGLFSVGNNLKSAKIAGDLSETNAKVISRVQESSAYKFISRKDLFDVEYWSLEQAKIMKPRKILEGHVVVITGSAGAIGSEIYKIFKNNGADIALLDKDKRKIEKFREKFNDLCLYCDVTKKRSVQKAFKKISEVYGGVDILISNAGTAISGPIAEIEDNILRQSFEDNFFHIKIVHLKP